MKKIILVCLCALFTYSGSYLLANNGLKNDFTNNTKVESKVRKWKFAVCT